MRNDNIAAHFQPVQLQPGCVCGRDANGVGANVENGKTLELLAVVPCCPDLSLSLSLSLSHTHTHAPVFTHFLTRLSVLHVNSVSLLRRC